MIPAATCDEFRPRRRRRPLFFGAVAQHMESLAVVWEVARAAAALAAVAAWGTVLLLLGG